MPRILFIVYELPPIGGGVARAATALLKQWQHSPLKIDVVTSSVNNCFEQESFSEHISIYKVPIGPKPPSAYQKQTVAQMARFTFSSWRQIRRLLRKNQYQSSLYFGYPSALVGRIYKQKVPYVVALRGVDVPGYNPKFDRFYWLHKPLSRWIWRGAKAVVANSEWLRLLAQETADVPIKVIPNGVDTDLFRLIADEKKFDLFTVTAGGTVMGSKKGLKHLVEGFAQFHQEHPDSRLLLFGSGDEEEALRQLVEQLGIMFAVEFTGQVSHEQLAEQLPRCHVFCLPSLAEGMSNAMLEAAACGLPIVATDVGGATELIGGDDEGGIIVQQQNSEQIAMALTKLYQNPKLRVKMGEKVRKKAESMGWKDVAREWEGYLR